MNKEILKPNPFFVDKDPENYRQLSIALSYAGNRLNQLIMKKQVADYRQANLAMKQELRKRKVLKDLSDFESFIPKSVRDELINNDIWKTAGETAQIIQGVAPAVQAPIARQPVPTQSPTLTQETTQEQEEQEQEEQEQEAPLLPQVVSVNKITEDMTKAEEIIRNLEQTINKKTTASIMKRYDDIQILGNERGLTDNSKVFLANIEAIHLVELDRRGERVEEEMPSLVVRKGEEEALRKAGEKPKRGRPKGSKNKPKSQTGKGLKRTKRRMDLLVGSAIAGNDNEDLLKVISKR